MKKILIVLLCLSLFMMVIGCASTDTAVATEAPVAEVVEEAKPAGVPGVTAVSLPGNTANSLEETVGPVIITVKTDTSFDFNDFCANGAKAEVVEFDGLEALKVTKNYDNQVRFAFVLLTPASMEGFTRLQFKVAGVEGAGGVYNCGLLYTEVKGSHDRVGSFYVSETVTDKWTQVDVDLATEEVWGANFGPDKTLYCIQFWSGAATELYVTDLKLVK